MNNFNRVFNILFGVLFLSFFIFALKTGKIYGGGKAGGPDYVPKEINPKKYWLITVGWFAMSVFEFYLAFFG